MAIHVNASDWDQISEGDRSKIASIMQEHGFLAKGEEITADKSAPPAKEVARAAASHLQASAKAVKSAGSGRAGVAAAGAAGGFNVCKIGCDIAEAAAVAACSFVPAPGNAVCIAAAHAGGEFCRSKCE
jgi:hypothetical protein